MRALVKTAKNEKYYQFSENEFTILSKKLSRDLEQDMNAFYKEIKILLEQTIVDRYYYRSGMIQSSLPYDEQIGKACELLKDKNRYANILNPSGQ